MGFSKALLEYLGGLNGSHHRLQIDGGKNSIITHR